MALLSHWIHLVFKQLIGLTKWRTKHNEKEVPGNKYIVLDTKKLWWWDLGKMNFYAMKYVLIITKFEYPFMIFPRWWNSGYRHLCFILYCMNLSKKGGGNLKPWNFNKFAYYKCIAYLCDLGCTTSLCFSVSG